MYYITDEGAGLTVTYKANGGLGSDVVHSVELGQLYTVASNATTAFTRPGYIFTGWNILEVGAGIGYQPSAEIEITESLVLYARWSSSGGTTISETPRPPEVIITPPETPQTGLDDVNHYAYIIGYGDSTVRPNNLITRAEAATIFFRLMRRDSRVSMWKTANTFSDVAESAWYNNAISTLVNAGMLNGYADGTFRPGSTITRAEFAVIAVRLMFDGDITSFPPNMQGYADTTGHWAENYIKLATANGYLAGYEDGSFRPNTPITRAEVATLLNNMLMRNVESSEDMLEGMKTWSDNPSGTWYYYAIQEATNSHFFERKDDSIYEIWTELRSNPDWTLLEKPGAHPGDLVFPEMPALHTS